ncbi:MAG: LUD domain-containing protein [Actinobacteria bacterium]|nr:LUD domain-containing protein [Thermoleophilia bacterium]MCB9010484.1 LUD domain-containing protein [Actinomycetota bacterium]
MTRLSGVSPAELRPGEDAIERFERELGAVQATFARSTPETLARRIVEALREVGARHVGLTADLGGGRRALVEALRAADIEAVHYEAAAPSRDALRAMDATVTGCVAAVAATGSIITGERAGRAGALIAPTHLCVVERERLLDGLSQALRVIAGSGSSMLALQSGPSRTADIEKTLIMGMHGPKAAHVVLLDGRLDEA